jgi:hypothetical protein
MEFCMLNLTHSVMLGGDRGDKRKGFPLFLVIENLY